jgi:hypothetical protein
MGKVGRLPKSVQEKKKTEKERVSLEEESKNMIRISELKESKVVGCEAEEGIGRRRETKLALEFCLLILSNPSGSNTIVRRLTTVIRPEKCVVRRFRFCANVIVCTYTNLDSIAEE